MDDTMYRLMRDEMMACYREAIRQGHDEDGVWEVWESMERWVERVCAERLGRAPTREDWREYYMLTRPR